MYLRSIDSMGVPGEELVDDRRERCAAREHGAHISAKPFPGLIQDEPFPEVALLTIPERLLHGGNGLLEEPPTQLALLLGKKIYDLAVDLVVDSRHAHEERGLELLHVIDNVCNRALCERDRCVSGRAQMMDELRGR